MADHISVTQISNYIGKDIVLKGWLYNRTDKGKLAFLLVRDRTGFVQCVAFKGDLTPELFETISHLPQESSIIITGSVREDKRAPGIPGGFEVGIKDLQVVQSADLDYPMALKDHGVLAFVLPRVFLSGSDWAPVREFLIKGGEYAYVVVSDDPKNYWAWSENTNLSEILLVYKKRRTQKELKTAVAFVRKRPRSALEARVLADLIINASKNTGVSSGGYSQTKIVKLESPSQTIPSLPRGAMPPILAYTYTVDRKIIEDVADKNLNLAIGFHTAELSSAAYLLYKQHSFLTAQLPLKTLPDYLSEWMAELDVCFGQERVKRGGHKKSQDYIGYDVRQVKDKCLDKGNIPIKALMEINKDTFSSLEVPQSSLKLTHVPRECFCRAGRLHIPGVARFRLTTIGVVTAYTSEPTISQVTWTIPISLEEAKVQALWLNTTPGLLHLLSLRQDSAGGFVQIKKEMLGNLLLLDVGRLETSQKEVLLRSARDIINGKRLPRLIDQFNYATQKKGIRYDLDKTFLKLFGVDIEKDDIAWQKMKELYEQLAEETLLGYSTKYPAQMGNI